MICLRLDLDYVPWDTANAETYGHGEPTMVLKLLDLARQTGVKFHFFSSNRSLRTFPTLADAILGEGHDLDWLTHYPDDPELFAEGKQLFSLAGHTIAGVAISQPWPQDLEPEWLDEIRFVTGPLSPVPPNLVFFPELDRFDQEVLGLGLGENIKTRIEEIVVDPENDIQIFTEVARPQILAKRDPELKKLKLLTSLGLRIRTLREALTE